MKCKKCLYEWKTRIEKPKNCPNCKQKLDDESRIVVIRFEKKNHLFQFPTEQKAREAIAEIEQKFKGIEWAIQIKD